MSYEIKPKAIEIKKEAIDKLRDATKRFFFEADGTLRPDMFGDEYPKFRLPAKLEGQISEQLGNQPLNTASQEQIIDAVVALTTNNELFFHQLESRMPKFGVMIDFYSAFDDYHGSLVRRETARPINVDALQAGPRGGGDGEIWPSNRHQPATPAYLASAFNGGLTNQAPRVDAMYLHKAKPNIPASDMGLPSNGAYGLSALTTGAERDAMLQRLMKREDGSGSGAQIGGGRITDPRNPDARRIIPPRDNDGSEG